MNWRRQKRKSHEGRDARVGTPEKMWKDLHLPIDPSLSLVFLLALVFLEHHLRATSLVHSICLLMLFVYVE